MTTHSLTYVNDSPVRLSPSGIHSGVDITIQNLGDNPIYLGGPGELHSENFGYKLLPGAAWSVELSGQDAIYAYADWGTLTAVLMTSLESGS
jgi:hypothetical protein